MRRSQPLMGTIVTIDAPRADADADRTRQAIDRAFGWFVHIERCCTRFDSDSELVSLTRQVGRPVRASPVLVEALRFALEVAAATEGAFDPTIGVTMARRGFNRHYRTGARMETPIESDEGVTYRDVTVDVDAGTVCLHRPLLVDLGAIAKGLAIDMAARELRPLEHFAIDAGGDLYLGGCASDGLPWSVGIRHPRRDNSLLARVSVSDRAVCTSGDYERREIADVSHLIDPRDRTAADAAASVTVVAPTALAADALATAAFVLGPEAGRAWLEEQGVDGLIVAPDMSRRITRGMVIDFDTDEAAPVAN